MRPNTTKVSSEYLYMLLSGEEIKLFTKYASAGSIHKGIRHGVLKEYKLAIPDGDVVKAFTANVQPMLQQLHINDKQNQELAALRDWLLPMLMNGQVRVAEAEEKVGLAIAAEGAGKYGKRKA